MGRQPEEYKDTFYSWVVCVATCIIGILLYGMLRASGIIFVALQTDFDLTRNQTAMITAASFGCFYATSISGGPIVQKFGFRKPILAGSALTFFVLFASFFIKNGSYLIITIGILQGTAFGIMAIPCLLLIPYYFDKYSGFATGLSIAGSPLGAIIMPPTIEYIIKSYGLSGTFLITSALSLHMIAGALIIHDPPKSITSKCEEKSTELEGIDNPALDVPIEQNENQDLKASQDGKTSWQIFKELLKNKYTYMLILLTPCPQTSLAAFSISVPAYAISNGANSQAASFLISIASIADVISRISVGILIDRKLLDLSLTAGIFAFLTGLSFCLFGLFGETSYEVLAALCGFYGFCFGSVFLHVPVASTHYLEKYAHYAVSIAFIISSTASFSAAPLLSSFYGLFGRYNEFYYVIGLAIIVCSLYILLLGITDTFKYKLNCRSRMKVAE